MTEKREAHTIRVPASLIAPIYGVITAIAGIAWAWQQSDKSTQVVLTGLQKDMATVTRTLTRLEIKSDQTRREFIQDLNGVKLQVENLKEKIGG